MSRICLALDVLIQDPSEDVVPAVRDRADVLAIIDSQWALNKESLQEWSEKMIDFADFYAVQVGGSEMSNVGLRDLIAWVRVKGGREEQLKQMEAYRDRYGRKD